MKVLLEGDCRITFNKRRPAISDIWHHNALFRIYENMMQVEYEPNKIEVRKNKTNEKKTYVIHFDDIKEVKTGGTTMGALFLTALQPYISISLKKDECICLHGTMFKKLQRKISKILERSHQDLKRT